MDLEQQAVDDETIFKDLDENDPLILERKNMIQAKGELDKHLLERADKSKKSNPTMLKMESDLKKRFQIHKIKFDEEKKKAEAVRREIERSMMKESGQEVHQNIKMPEYVINQELNVYEEVNVPPKALYKSVGYNDMQRVKIIMEGDDSDKRSSLNRKQEEEELKKSPSEFKRLKTSVRLEAKDAELEKKEEENRIT